MMVFKQQVALELINCGAVQFGSFKLKLHEENPDAPLSPIYLNLRTPDNPKPGPLTPNIVGMITVLMASLIDHLKFDLVCGVPNAGDPYANTLYALIQDLLTGIVRLGKSEQDGKRAVTHILPGDWQPDQTVLLVDDLITQAHSKLEAIEVLKGAGLIVRDLVVLVDREQGGVADLEARGYATHSAFKLTELVNFYASEGLITRDFQKHVLAYLAGNF